MNYPRGPFSKRWLVFITMLFGLFLCLSEASARVGGGGSYSGSSSSGGGGGSSGDGGFILWLILRLVDLHIYYPKVAIVIDLLLIATYLFFHYYNRDSQTRSYSSKSAASTAFESDDDVTAVDRFAEWRRLDPNFSELLFEDFLYSLYGHVHTARGQNRLGEYAPYFSENARKTLQNISPDGLQQVLGIVIGSFSLLRAGTTPDRLTATIRFESNYTERTATSDSTWYAVEEWQLARDRSVQSKPPGPPRAANCPKCGAGLSLTPDGTCTYCSTRVIGGQLDWGVTSIRLVNREPRGPLLTSDVPDVGLDRPTIIQPNFVKAESDFVEANPNFDVNHFESRARFIFTELQEAWSTLEWEKARPFESDSVFQMHGYWIEAYRKQRLRNVIKNVEIHSVKIVKYWHDAFYDGITCRIYAELLDFVQDSSGKIVRGSDRRPTSFSEYWTFVRRRGTAENNKPASNCPNCGAELKINMAGSCEYCGSKITSGDFDWVLSRIEQDESYKG